jgi:hypothetical protein
MLCSSTNPANPWFAGMDKLKLYPESKLYLDKYLPSWDGLREIDPAEWDELLHNYREDVHRRAQKSKFLLAATAPNYDSQLFNVWGVLHGRACFKKAGKCYDRSQLNYFAQGELWAAVGVSKEQGHNIVRLWKRKSCFHLPVFGGGEVCMNPSSYDEPSKEVLEMFDEGYDDYNKYYPSTP